MTGRDLRGAGIRAGLGLAIVAVIAAIALNNRDLIPIPTAPPVVPDENGAVECLSALSGGRLVASPQWGIAVVRGQDAPAPMFWPNGYAGRIAGDRIELLDGDGELVARTGDQVRVGGGEITMNGVLGWIVCPIGIGVHAAAP